MESNDHVHAKNLELRSKIADSEALVLEAKARRSLFHKISKTLTLEPLQTLLAEEIEKLHAFDGYLINLVDQSEVENSHRSHNSLKLICEHVKLPPGYEGVARTYRKYRFTQSLNDINIQAFNSGKAIRVHRSEIDGLPETTQSHFERWNIEQMVCLPLKIDKSFLELSSIGTIAAFVQNGEIDADTETQLHSLIHIFYKPIRNALEHEQLLKREHDIRIAQQEHTRFLSFITAINNLSDEEHIYELISKELLHRFPFDLVGVLLEEYDQLVVKELAVSDLKFNRQYQAWREYYAKVSYNIDVSDGATPVVYIQNTYVLVPDVEEIRHLPMSEKDRKALELLETPRSFLFVPIRLKDKPIGMLWLFSLENAVELDNDDVKLIELLGTFIGNALNNANIYSIAEKQHKKIERLNTELQDKIIELHDGASKDRLTGLYNYSAFVQELERRVYEFKRLANQHLSMIFFDIDHFKKVNEKYGHITGNDILCELANHLQKVVRTMDIACRYGGEEFAIILPRCDLEGAYTFAERIRKHIAQEKYNADGIYIDISVSIGCVTMRPNDTYEMMIERADKALYKAKKSGRNRTVCQKR